MDGHLAVGQVTTQSNSRRAMKSEPGWRNHAGGTIHASLISGRHLRFENLREAVIFKWAAIGPVRHPLYDTTRHTISQAVFVSWGEPKMFARTELVNQWQNPKLRSPVAIEIETQKPNVLGSKQRASFARKNTLRLNTRKGIVT